MHRITFAAPSGTIAAIPAKTHAHRALIAAALADSPSTLTLHRFSDDIDATIASLNGLGATVTKTATGVSITPIPRNASGRPHTTHGDLCPHESGTTLRLLLPVAAAVADSTDVTAHGRLPDRPLEPLFSEMKGHGAQFSAPKPPFTVTGPLTGGQFSMVGNVSSQFFSGLLLTAPIVGGASITSTTELQSRDYVRLTMGVMKDFGVTVDESADGNTFTVPAGASFHGRQDYAIEGDWSNGAIWLVAAALTGAPITVVGLSPDSVQADRRIAEVVANAGTTLTAGTDTATGLPTLTASGRAVNPLDIDLRQMPDLLPVLATLACGINGTSTFRHGERLRLKESDRLVAVADLVNDLGGQARLEGDDLIITGTGHLAGGQARCCNDHRLVMAGTLAALISFEAVTLEDSQAISKSYPDFFSDWNLLGGKAREL